MISATGGRAQSRGINACDYLHTTSRAELYFRLFDTEQMCVNILKILKISED